MFKEKFMAEVIKTFNPSEGVLWLVEFAYNVGQMSGKIEQIETTSSEMYNSMLKANNCQKH